MIDFQYLPSVSDLRANLIRSDLVTDSVKWVKKRLPEEFIWSKQKEILRSIDNNRKTAVHSCHRIGKTFIGAVAALKWIDTHPPGTAFVITSAHSSAQVKIALWREMSRLHAKYKFPGRMNQQEWYMTMPAGNEELVAFGRKPKDDDSTALQGFYNRYILVLLDEACYVPLGIWNGLNTLISNNDSRIMVWGNPDDPNTKFAEVCKPGSDWNVIGIGYQDTPNFTGEKVPERVSASLIGPTWVEEVKSYGESSPYYISKVLGQFPEISEDALIPQQWIKAATDRWGLVEESLPVEIGVDVGGGGDKNVICVRKGPVARIVKRDQEPDTMKTLSNVLSYVRDNNATSAKIDYIGIGHGAVDRAKEMSKDQSIIKETPDLALRAGTITGINVSLPAEDKERFVNIRAEAAWRLRELFQDGFKDPDNGITIDPSDKPLLSQLSSIKYYRSAGRIQVESKKEMKARHLPSPDEFDSLVLAYYKPKKKKIIRATRKLKGMRNV